MYLQNVINGVAFSQKAQTAVFLHVGGSCEKRSATVPKKYKCGFLFCSLVITICIL